MPIPKRPVRRGSLVFAFAAVLLCTAGARAQATAFTYQGRLTDGANPANGSYDLQFALWDSLSGGAQIGSTLTRAAVSVSGGIFTVQLDFGVSAFPGADRYLEISVRPAGGGTFTTLAPRQQISSTPYAIRTLSAAAADTATNATQLGGVAASQYVQTNDSRLSDSRSPTAGSSNYIQSNPATQQAGANFNISGNGTIGGNLTVNGSVSYNTVNAQMQYNLAGTRILSNSGINNLFVGASSGGSNTSGCCNAFFGFSAGAVSNANDNSFFGNNTGAATTDGNRNSFFGSAAGFSNVHGISNSFFGVAAGRNNTGNNNSFFGDSAGFNNTASGNSFFGINSGFSNTSGVSNSFFGFQSGFRNVTEHDNTFIGYDAGQNNGLNDSGGNANYNTFAGALAGQANTTGQKNSFFGAGAGGTASTDFQNSFFGYNAGTANQGGTNNSFFGSEAGKSTTTGATNSFFGAAAGFFNTTGDSNAFFGNAAGLRNSASSNNSFFGTSSGFNTNGGSYNSFFGFESGLANQIGASNSLFGASAGRFSTGDFNTFFGTAAGSSNTSGNSNTAIGVNADVASGNLSNATAIGAGAVVSTSNTIMLGRGFTDNVIVGNRLRVQSIPLLASTASVCFNSAGDLLQCGASSLRWKTNVQAFRSGLDIVRRLRPISFNWKEDGRSDIGLGAEDVANIAPSFTFTDKNGEIAGVKYERLNLLLINAVKEQQTEIEELRKQVRQLRASRRRNRR